MASVWYIRPMLTSAHPHVIMIVDDDEAARTIYGNYFEAGGFEVVAVRRGGDAVGRALQYQPEIVIMDLMMPGMSGVTATRMLKAHPATERIPVLAVTASMSGSLRREALAAGCEDVILKPFPPEQLVAVVLDFLDTRSRQPDAQV
jgi:CheY-like chemotaxis protein